MKHVGPQHPRRNSPWVVIAAELSSVLVFTARLSVHRHRIWSVLGRVPQSEDPLCRSHPSHDVVMHAGCVVGGAMATVFPGLIICAMNNKKSEVGIQYFK